MKPLFEQMQQAIIEGDPTAAVELGRKALDQGAKAIDIIHEVITPAMTVVGDRFEQGEYFLPEMMAAALGARGIMEVIRPDLVASDVQPVAVAVIGSVQGDLHDIGKNLVSMMWEGAGFSVIDLGSNTPAQKFVDAIREHDADLVGLSALLTTTMPMMRSVIETIRESGLRDRVKIMVGGAAVTQRFADEIGADGYAPDANSAARLARSLMGLP